MRFRKVIVVLAVLVLANMMLTACNKSSDSADQGDQTNAAVVAPQTAITAPTTSDAKPTDAPISAPTQTPSKSAPSPTSSAAKTAATPKTVNTPTTAPVPTPVPAVQSSTKKQGDDLDQQLDQLVKDMDKTDTVDDAGH